MAKAHLIILFIVFLAGLNACGTDNSDQVPSIKQDDLLPQAIQMLADGQNANAKILLGKLQREHPLQGEIHYWLAMAHLQAGEPHGFISEINQAKQYMPDDYRPYLESARYYLAGADYNRAKNEASQALNLQKDNLDASLVFCYSLYYLKEYQAALHEVKKSLGIHQKNTELQLLQSNILLRLGDEDASYAVLIKILHDQPHNTKALAELISRGVDQGNVAEVLPFIDAALLESKDQTAVILFLQGKIFDATGNYGKAMESYAAAKLADVDFVEPYYAIARIYELNGQIDQAINEYQHVIERHQRDARSYYELGILFLNQNKLLEAEEALDNAVQYSPRFAMASARLARIIAEKPAGDMLRALGLAAAAKESEPANPFILDTLGWVNLKSGSFVAAAGFFKDALRFDPDNPAILYHYALALKAAGKLDQAWDALNNALNSGVDFPERAEAEKLLANWL